MASILQALNYKYPNVEWILYGNTYSGLQAVKDDGNGTAIPDTENMITEEEYNLAIEDYKVIEAWIEIRKQRNQLLKDSDYIMVSDAPVGETQKQEWTTYRQSLRDIPQTFSNPDEVVYPTKPK